jgi:gamma-glutamyltranspeptidase
MGHKVRVDKSLTANDAMGILIDRRAGRLYGAADPRSEDGSAAGY